MALGAKVERVLSSKPTSSSAFYDNKALLNSSISKLSQSGLAELCRKVRALIIQQKLPFLCLTCRPILFRAINMELNLTQMFRGLCQGCMLFFKNPDEAVTALPKANSRVQKVILKVDSLEGFKVKDNVSNFNKKKLRTDISIFEALTEAGMDWCRYCGTTNGVNWRPGPWGQRTLCNKHGCAYHGYGFSKGLSHLDLSKFEDESLEGRKFPVVQESCCICQSSDDYNEKKLLRCFGCPKAVHSTCLSWSSVTIENRWFCSEQCPLNIDIGLVPGSPVKERKQRSPSEPGITPKKKYAKKFNLVVPPTPPPSPPLSSSKSCGSAVVVGRKRRATADTNSDVLVCFDSDLPIKRAVLERSMVFTPSFKPVVMPSPLAKVISPKKQTSERESLSEEELVRRHSRYEEVEKTQRLCRPHLLKTLFNNEPIGNDPTGSI